MKWPDMMTDEEYKAFEKKDREERRIAQLKQEQEYDDKKRRKWKDTTLPASFRQLEASLETNVPPGVDAIAFEQAFAWMAALTTRNLFLYGGTGAGKTFTGHSLINHASTAYTGARLERGAIARVDGMRFQREIPARLMREKNDGTGSLAEFIDPLRNADILFFDELDKLSGSNRVSMEFFSLLNDRIEANQTTILASYGGPVDVAQVFERANEKQLGVQIARRIADFFTIIKMERGNGEPTPKAPRAPMAAKVEAEKEEAF